MLTAIFYALLTANVFHIQDILIQPENPSPDYLNDVDALFTDQEDVTQSYYDTTSGKHFASPDRNGIITFEWTYTSTDKADYTNAFSKLFSFIDINSTQTGQIESVIKQISISNENGNRRGYATRDTIMLNLGSVKSKDEFAQLITHEIGHITDLGYIEGKSTRKSIPYTEFGQRVFGIDDLSIKYYAISRTSETIRRAEAKKKDFCSGYGMSDPFEDFAECFNLYINHNALFKQIAKTNTLLSKKYNFIAWLFNGKYMVANKKDIFLLQSSSTRRPRDTTKI